MSALPDLLLNTRTRQYFRYSRELAGRPHIVAVNDDSDPLARWVRKEWINQWKGQTVVCLASGPSIRQTDIDLLEKMHSQGRCKVIAVNNSCLLTPWADILFAGDVEWWAASKSIWHGFAGEKWTSTTDAAKEYGLNYIARDFSGEGLCKGAMVPNENSGQQAINLAYHLGASKIVLLGYEMNPSEEKLHFFGSHNERDGLSNPCASVFEGWHKKFRQLADDMRLEDIPVVNCSTNTALTCFECGQLEKELV